MRQNKSNWYYWILIKFLLSSIIYQIKKIYILSAYHNLSWPWHCLIHFHLWVPKCFFALRDFVWKQCYSTLKKKLVDFYMVAVWVKFCNWPMAFNLTSYLRDIYMCKIVHVNPFIASKTIKPLRRNGLVGVEEDKKTRKKAMLRWSKVTDAQIWIYVSTTSNQCLIWIITGDIGTHHSKFP